MQAINSTSSIHMMHLFASDHFEVNARSRAVSNDSQCLVEMRIIGSERLVLSQPSNL
jgi:hypothetical protein